MKLTDIDLSSLAEVAAAVTLLEHVHRSFVTGDGSGTPLPVIDPGFVVDPTRETEFREEQIALSLLPPTQGCGETMMTPFARQQSAPTAVPFPAQPVATVLQQGTQSVAFQSMDAASVFGGAPAQSAAPLPPAPSTAGAAASQTAPVAPLGSGAGANALPALAPLPAPSAAAPAAPVAQPSLAGGVELDTDGLPWDARIHAGTKRKNADGRWTAKKGINDPDLVPRVVAQLRAQMATGGVTAPSATALPPAPPGSLGAALGVPQMTLGQLQEAQMLANVTPPVVAQSAAPLPASTPAPSTAPLAALPATSGPASLAAPTPPALPSHQPLAVPQQSSGAPAPTTYLDFMTAATVEVQSGRVPIEAFGEVCKSLGGATALSTKPELIPTAWAMLKDRYPGML